MSIRKNIKHSKKKLEISNDKLKSILSFSHNTLRKFQRKKKRKKKTRQIKDCEYRNLGGLVSSSIGG